MKKTLLEIVQKILSDMNSDEVDSIVDTAEAEQVATVVEYTFYNLFTNKLVPEHQTLLKLTPASDSEVPTQFNLQDTTKQICNVWYVNASTGVFKELYWKDPLDFLKSSDGLSSNYTTVQVGGTDVRIRTDRDPSYYTTFDDEILVMDSYDSTIEDTLQQSKVRAMGYVHPTFSKTDSFVPDLDANLFPLLISEATSTAFSVIRGAPDIKTEQHATYNRRYVQNDTHRTPTRPQRPRYGRNARK